MIKVKVRCHLCPVVWQDTNEDGVINELDEPKYMVLDDWVNYAQHILDCHPDMDRAREVWAHGALEDAVAMGFSRRGDGYWILGKLPRTVETPADLGVKVEADTVVETVEPVAVAATLIKRRGRPKKLSFLGQGTPREEQSLDPMQEPEELLK